MDEVIKKLEKKVEWLTARIDSGEFHPETILYNHFLSKRSAYLDAIELIKTAL